MKSMNVRRAAIVATALAIVAVGVTCSRDLATGSGGSALRVLRPTLATLAPDLRGRVESAMRQTAWVGQMHTDMMLEFASRRSVLVGDNRRDRARICAGVHQFVTEFAPRFAERAGISRSDDENRDDVSAAVRARVVPCRGSRSMSLFGTGTIAESAMPVVRQEGDSDVSAAVEAFLDSLISAIQATDGSPGQVSAAVDGVLASAASLPIADLNLLAATSGLAYESASYAQSVDNSGGLIDVFPGDPNDTTFQYPQMSLFSHRRAMNWGAVLALALADTYACIAGELSAIHGGHRDERYLYTECGIWGGAASIATLAVLVKAAS